MKESTIIMLWMLIFLLLITFWVDVRLKALREECLTHYMMLERLIMNADRMGNTRKESTTGYPSLFSDTDAAPWFSDSNSAVFDSNAGVSRPLAIQSPRSNLLPDFIDDLVPTKDELSKALRGVGCSARDDQWTYPGKIQPAVSGTTGPQLEGYDESNLYAPAWI